MLNAVIRAALNNRLFVLAVAVGVLGLGLMRLRDLSIDVLPDLTRPRVTLITECPGLAPQEVEALVSLPLENAVNGANGVTAVRSSSGIGLSVIYVDFDWGQDIYVARQIVGERIATVTDELPAGVRPEVGPISSLLGQIMLVGMWSKTGETDALQLRTLGDWVVRQQLKGIDGVAQVITMGGGKQQFQVLVDLHELHKFELQMSDIEEALSNGNLNVAGGYLQMGGEEAVLRGLGRVKTVDDIKQMVVSHNDRRSVLIEDVAEVRLGAMPRRGDSSVNGSDAVVLTIQKQPGADTRAVSDRIDTQLQQIARGLPDDVEIAVTYQQREFIDYSVHNVMDAVRDGAILVVVVLFLFLLNLRTTAITLTAIPLSLLTTAVIFYWCNLSINVMTLGGIAVALGELVDDAIVDIENIFRRLKQNRQSDSPRNALAVVYDASSEVRGAILMSTIMVVLVFAPLFALTGMEGRLFTPLGIAYVVSIIASTLVSLTVTPVLSYYLLPQAKATSRGDGLLLRGLKATLRPILGAGASPLFFWPMASLAMIAVLASLATVYNMGKGFLPDFDEGAAQVNLFLRPGASLESSTAIRRMADERFAKLLRTADNPSGPLLWFTCKTGRAENDEHIMGVNTSEFVMSLNPDSGLSREELIGTLSDSVADLAGVEVEVEQPIAHLISHMLSGVTAQIAVKIYGDDLRELIKLADRAKVSISRIEGLADPVVQPIDYVKQVQVSVRREQLARYGLSVAAVHRFLETAYNGRVVSKVIDGQRVFDLVVKFDDEIRQDVDLLKRLPIEFEDGNRVPLGELADIRLAEAPSEINRENAQRMIVVRVNTRGKPLSTAVDEIQATLLDELALPEGYTVQYAGQFEAQESATQRLLLFSLLALAGVFVVLYSTFSSTNLVLQILLALPIAFAGGVAAITLTGQDLNVASMVGFISLGGIAARNGILLIETYLARIKEGIPLREAVVNGSLDRTAPVLMTALTTGIGLLPLVVGGHLPGKEILFPVATVIVGGLITSTAAEFLLRPGLFMLMHQGASGNNSTTEN